MGSITFSVDDGQTYAPMQCAAGCTGDTPLPAPTSRIVVDGNTDGSTIAADTRCLAGGATSPGTNNRCTVNVPVSFIFLFVQSYPFMYQMDTLRAHFDINTLSFIFFFFHLE